MRCRVISGRRQGCPAALVAAAVLIWKYWDPIKAFFAGVFSGIMEKLAPLRETFERFGPVFDIIGSGISQVFNWFKSLLSPMESSKETLDKCTSAGEVFGNVLGGALQLVLKTQRGQLPVKHPNNQR